MKNNDLWCLMMWVYFERDELRTLLCLAYICIICVSIKKYILNSSFLQTSKGESYTVVKYNHSLCFSQQSGKHVGQFIFPDKWNVFVPLAL